MARASRGTPSASIPDLANLEEFSGWLRQHPHEWSVVIASRASLRLLPLAAPGGDSAAILRANAIAWFAAKYPMHDGISEAAGAAASAARRSHLYTYNSILSQAAADVADAVNLEPAGRIAANLVRVISRVTPDAVVVKAAFDSARRDVEALLAGTTAAHLMRMPLWHSNIRSPVIKAIWADFVERLDQEKNAHWPVWINWYNDIVSGVSHNEAEDIAFTDIPGSLPWPVIAKVNRQIGERLESASPRSHELQIPDQTAAPVRVEDRNGKVAQISDRDSSLNAAELDFKDWRIPVVNHISQLTTSDFAAGTNHSRVRERLITLSKLLPGKISRIKGRQFRIGYEVERFEGLLAAYRSGADDMPVLNAAQLEDLSRLLVALKIGVGKLERWLSFWRLAQEGFPVKAEVDPGIVGDALAEMADVMEQHPKYFDSELPATFRFIVEAVRDPFGATKAIVYGAVKSAENLISFLGQTALGMGRSILKKIEKHITKVVATTLIAALSAAAMRLSGALPQAWAWLGQLLNVLGING